MRAYDLDHYDSDSEDEDGADVAMLENVQSLAYHESNSLDPHMTANEDEQDEEREDLQILATDNLLAAAKVEDEVAHLEIYVYEDEAANLYVHHDIMLPAIPLCVEWLDLPVGKDTNLFDRDRRGNYVAVGTFEPDIELWDLDTVDSMYPDAILGQGESTAQPGSEDNTVKKKKRKKSKKANSEYHVDAVLSLSANRQHRNLLASSSADKTIKLWDLNILRCAQSYSYHTDKVCSIAWNPTQATVLLSGSYDRNVVVADMRAPDAQKPRWTVDSDVETVAWDPHHSETFFVTTEGGVLQCNDTRNAATSSDPAKPLWTLQAHDTSISSFDVNPTIPGFLVTGSSDRTVKLWNVQENKPSLVASRDLDVGRVFTTRFAPDQEVTFRLAVGGSKGSMQIWDTSTNPAVRRVFASRLPSGEAITEKERVVGLEENSSSSDSEDEQDGETKAPEAERNEAGWESMDEDGVS